MKSNSLAILILLLAMSIQFSGCKVYSFSGASIDPEIQSMSISYFDNRSGNGPASVGQIFTDVLQNKFRRETSLNIVEREGDLQISGSITAYTVSLQAASAAGQDDFNKLTIAVQINYVNTKDPEDQWTQTFSNFELVASSTDLTSVENTIIETISEQLSDNIFNQALVKW